MREIRLDFLANFPHNHKANALLMRDDLPNPNTLESSFIQSLSADSKQLASMFGMSASQSFDYTSGSFALLFQLLHTHHFHIALASSLHQQSFYAAALYPSITLFAPCQTSGVIDSLPSMPSHKNLALFIPYINQDILTQNPIDTLISQTLHSYPNALIFLDISLLASVLDSRILSVLCALTHPQIVFLCNAENIGLMRPSGFLLSHTRISQEHKEILHALSRFFLLRAQLFQASYLALQDILRTPKISDEKFELYKKLKLLLDDSLSLFAPLESTLPNALPLRFRHIKARLLIQALSVEGIFAINGQDCLFGNAKPSFVLASQGYDEPSTRELLSISYHHALDLDALAHRLSNAYFHLRQF